MAYLDDIPHFSNFCWYVLFGLKAVFGQIIRFYVRKATFSKNAKIEKMAL